MTNNNFDTTSIEVYSLAEAEDAALLKSDAAPLSQGKLVRRRFLHHRGAMISLVCLTLITILAFSSIGFAGIPGWWGKSYLAAADIVNGGRPTLSLLPEWLGGSGIVWGENPFGQDSTGKDYFALVMNGTQKSLIIGFVVGLVATFIGAVVGATSGYFGGIVDSLLMRITDVFIVIPLLAIAAVLGKVVSNVGGGSILVLAVVLGVLTWTGLARLVRGEVLSLREREFVAAAQAMGATSGRIVFQHLLPNTIGVIVVNATFAIAGAILLESALSFLGFGVQPPESSLGLLISQYQNSFASRPWLFWFPGITILVIALSVNFIGDGLRDAFDPRQTRSARRLMKARKNA